MAPILSAIEKRIAVVKNAIAIIVVYFLFVIIIVSGHLTCDFFSQCKDRAYFASQQTFSPHFNHYIASGLLIRDNPCHPLPNLSPRCGEKTKKSQQASCRASECSILWEKALCRASECAILREQALHRPSACSILREQASCRASACLLHWQQASCRASECSIL